MVSARGIREAIGILLEYKRGLIGLSLLIFFVILAIFAPWIAPHKPDEVSLADAYAYPVWFRYISKKYRDLPPNVWKYCKPGDWEVSISPAAAGAWVRIERDGNLTITFSPPNASSATVVLEVPLDYEYAPPRRFAGRIPFEVKILGSGSAQVLFVVVDPDGQEYLLYDSYPIAYNESHWDPPASFDAIDIMLKLRLGLSPYDYAGEKVFAKRGVYKLRLVVSLESYGGRVIVKLGTVTFRIFGRIFGLLGTDNLGSDLFSQLVYGTRVSLIVGILASVISVSIGLVVGIVAGYKGGIVDQLLMLLTDTLYLIPILPLMIALVVVFGKNLYLEIALIAALSWMWFARNCRAYVMAIRDSGYVQAARALGASDIYIIFRHILPQLAPIIYITLALRVPGAILLEAALSFLGLGDPSVPSWGRMLHNAQYGGAFARLMWWWIIPPGLMITLLALSFVLIGQALDEVLNPRLRMRRG